MAHPPSRHLRLLIQRGTWGGRWSYNYRLGKSYISSCCFCLFPAITVIIGQIGINRPPQVENHLTPVLVWVLSVAGEQKGNLAVHDQRVKPREPHRPGSPCPRGARRFSFLSETPNQINRLVHRVYLCILILTSALSGLCFSDRA